MNQVQTLTEKIRTSSTYGKKPLGVWCSNCRGSGIVAGRNEYEIAQCDECDGCGTVQPLQRRVVETLDVSDETENIPSNDLDWLDWLDGHRDEPLPFELTPKAWRETGRGA